MNIPVIVLLSAVECESLGDELAFEPFPLCLDDILPIRISQNQH